MGTKRAHPSSEVHPSRRPQVPAEASHKKRKVNPNPGRHLEKKRNPINPLKSRIRSLQRLLEHNEDLPADVRIGHERELASCKWELQEAERQRKKKETVGRYHMVRFFERQKATRQLKKLQRRKNTGSEVEEKVNEQAFAAAIHEAEVDLNYTMYSPLDWPYVSLYPKEKGKPGKGNNADDEDNEEKDQQKDTTTTNDSEDPTVKGDPQMRALVEQCMRDGRLDDLRNGRMTKDKTSAKDIRLPSRPKKAEHNKAQLRSDSKAGKKTGKKMVDDKMDEDSDGGFFE